MKKNNRKLKTIRKKKTLATQERRGGGFDSPRVAPREWGNI